MLYNDLTENPGVAQLVARVVWELEHRTGTSVRKVDYFPCSAYYPAVFSANSFNKMWRISFDHISDHNGSNFKTSYPGVAQLVARLVWDQDAAGSNPVTRTKRPLISCDRGLTFGGVFFFDYSGAEFDSKSCHYNYFSIYYVHPLPWRKHRNVAQRII